MIFFYILSKQIDSQVTYNNNLEPIIMETREKSKGEAAKDLSAPKVTKQEKGDSTKTVAKRKRKPLL